MAFGCVFVFVFSFVVHLTTGDNIGWNTPYRPQFHGSYPRQETFVGPPYAIVKHNKSFHVWHEMVDDVRERDSVDSVWGYESSSNLVTWHSGPERLYLGSGRGSAFVNSDDEIVLFYLGFDGIYLKTSSDGVRFSQGELLVEGNFRNPVAFTLPGERAVGIVALEDGPDGQVLKIMPQDVTGQLRLQSVDFFNFSQEMFRDGHLGPLREEVPRIESFDIFSVDGYYVLLVTVAEKTLPNGYSGSMYWLGHVSSETHNGTSVLVYQYLAQSEMPGFMDDGLYGFCSYTDGSIVEVIGAMADGKHSRTFHPSPSRPYPGGLTFPRVLRVSNDSKGYTIRQHPAYDVLRTLRCTKCYKWRRIDSRTVSVNLRECECPMSKVTKHTTLLEFECEFLLDHQSRFTPVVTLSSSYMAEADIGYRILSNGSVVIVIRAQAPSAPDHVSKAQLEADRSRSSSNVVTFHGIVDANSIELFAINGHAVLTSPFYPTSPINKITFRDTRDRSVYRLKSGLTDIEKSDDDYEEDQRDEATPLWSTMGIFPISLIIVFCRYLE